MAFNFPKKVGKAQARKEFSALVEAVACGAGPIEIMDHGKVAAVLLSEAEYRWLYVCAKKHAEPKRSPRGLIVLLDDNAVDDASKALAAGFDNSISKAATEL